MARPGDVVTSGCKTCRSSRRDKHRRRQTSLCVEEWGGQAIITFTFQIVTFSIMGKTANEVGGMVGRCPTDEAVVGELDV